VKNKLFFRTIVLVLVLIHVWFGFIISQHTYLGIIIQKTSSGDWVIRQLEAGGGSEKLNLMVGDTIQLVDGKRPIDYFTTKWGSIEQAETIIVSRNEEIIEVQTNGVRESPTVNSLPLAGTIICFVFAYLLYFKARHSKSSLLLSLVFVNLAIIFTSLGASIRGDAIGKVAIGSLMVALPVVFLHFLFVFMKEKAGIEFSKKSLRYLYGFVVISCLQKFLYFLPAETTVAYYITFYSIIVSFLIGTSLNFFFLTLVYIKYRRQSNLLPIIFKTVLWAFLISFAPTAGLSFVPMLLYKEAVIDAMHTAWLVLVFPVSFAYLIISKQLYDIDLVLRRIVFTIAIAIIPSAVLVGLNAMIFSHDLTAKHLLLSFIVTLTVLTFVIYSLEYFATKLQPTMFPRKHQLQLALKKISTNLQSISSYRELKDIILVDIVHTLQVFGAAIAFKYSDNRVEAVLEGDIQLSEVEMMASAVSVDDDSSLFRYEINRHEEYTSYLIITRKKMNTFIATEEQHWLNLIISYLAVSLENMHLIGKLNVRLQKLAAQLPNEEASQDFRWFRKLMFELQENERQRIATDIHDTTLQDLFFLKKRFSSLLDRTEFSQEASETIRNIIEYVEIINTNLRQSCFELHPHLLYEIGLLRTLHKVIEHEKPFCPFELEFQSHGAEQAELLDMDKKRHLFRIVQELLNNAKKHSEANEVRITLSVEDHSLLLFYEDDGTGLEVRDSEDAEPQIGDSGTGMAQMKSRVLYMDGRLDFRTDRGEGLQIWIRLPIREAVVA